MLLNVDLRSLLSETLPHMEQVQLPSCGDRLDLHFQHLTYTVARRKGSGTKHILHDLNGQFNSGRLTAIMGASGAGKTSLLNVLSGFKTKGVTGSVIVNGVERDPDEFRTKSCYIVQDPPMLPQLTCRETLAIAADLKLKPGWRKDNATRSVVTSILHLLGLTDADQTYVKSLSGGQKKRLSIGLELLTNPPIMFFDEPTSGLDSVAAAQMILHLQTLSALGHAIICVIHQPSSHIFNMFDDLYLLSDGQCLYSGPTADMVRVFQQAGFTCPEYYNRADFAIEVACKQRGNDLSSLQNRFQSSSKETVVLSNGETTECSPMLVVTPSNGTENKDASIVDLTKAIKFKKSTLNRYTTSQTRQFYVLLKRCLTCTLRDMLTVQIMLGSHIVTGFFFGMVYYNIGDEASKIDSNLSYLFCSLIFLYFCNAMTTVVLIPQEMSVFLHEHLNTWYSLPSYYFAKLLSTYPFQMLYHFSFTSIAYYMTGQPLVLDRFLMTWLGYQMMALIAQAVGLVVGAMFDVQLGTFLVVAMAIPMFIFSGFLSRILHIADYLLWIPPISYVKQSYEAIVTALYGFDRPKLQCGEAFCPYRYTQRVLEDFVFSEQMYWWDILALVVWALFVYVWLYIVLKWRVYKSK